MGTKMHDVENAMVFTSFDGKPRTVKLLEESVSLVDMDLTRFGERERERGRKVYPAGQSLRTKIEAKF